MSGAENSQSSNQGRELLVVDDEQNMRHMLRSLLQTSGFKVTAASNGQEALEMVSKIRYDYILCDIKMPKMDGLQFLDKAARWLGDTTVIMMSAYGSMDTALEARKKERQEADAWRLQVENLLRRSRGEFPLEDIGELKEEMGVNIHDTSLDVTDPLVIEAGETMVDFIGLQ